MPVTPSHLVGLVPAHLVDHPLIDSRRCQHRHEGMPERVVSAYHRPLRSLHHPTERFHIHPVGHRSIWPFRESERPTGMSRAEILSHHPFEERRQFHRAERFAFLAPLLLPQDHDSVREIEIIDPSAE